MSKKWARLDEVLMEMVEVNPDVKYWKAEDTADVIQHLVKTKQIAVKMVDGEMFFRI